MLACMRSSHQRAAQSLVALDKVGCTACKHVTSAAVQHSMLLRYSAVRHASLMKRASNKWLNKLKQQQRTQSTDSDDGDQPSSKELTPMLKQWHDIKARYSNYMILMRIGQFYEILYDDAAIAAQVLSITLTSRANRDAASQSEIPMCGIPYFTLESYLSKLIKAGHLVAIVEQMDETKQPGTAVMDRQVTRLITPGTLIESSLLNPKYNNYLCSIVQSAPNSSQLAIAFVDVSTGQFYTITCTTSTLAHHIARIQPSEVLLTADTHEYIATQLQNIRITLRDEASFSRNVFIDLWHSMNNRDTVVDKSTLSDIDQRHVEHEIQAIEQQVQQFSRTELRAAGALLDYIRVTHQNTLPKLTLPRRQLLQEYMSIDAVTRRALEITNSLANPTSKQQTLLDCLDATVTPQGARLLSTRISLPLLDIERIHRRLDVIEYFTHDYNLLDAIQSILRNIADIERTIQRISLKRSSPRDLHSIKESIALAQRIHSIIVHNNNARLAEDFDNNDKNKLPKYLVKLLDTLRNEQLQELHDKLHAAVKDPPPMTLETGHFVNPGYSEELDKLQQAKQRGKAGVQQLEQQYRAETGIQSLKIRQNQQLLHFVELTGGAKARLDGMSDDIKRQFVPIQSLKNVHRYKTEALSTLQDDLLTSDTQINEMERQIFDTLRLATLAVSEQLMKLAHSIAIIDLSVANAKLSQDRNYCRPSVIQQSERTGHRFDIKQGRHPVVEERMTYARHHNIHSAQIPRGVASTALNDSQLLDAEVEKSAAQSAISEVLPFMSIIPMDIVNSSNRLLAEKLVEDSVQQSNQVAAVVDFEPNDCVLEGEQRVWLLTGSNMSGKSTVLRQNALIAIMAQAGLFVPASSAAITVIDQVFCRVGASDDISNALSTFMVEMQETAHILTNATKHSLCIFDELGRGTSTRDGLALASSCLEYIHNTIECRAMFATHFTELAALVPRLPYLSAMRTAVQRNGEQILFLHKLEPGVSQHSYGIFVARLAGLPEPVLERATVLLERFQQNTHKPLTDSLLDEPAGDTDGAEGAAADSEDDNKLAKKVRKMLRAE